MMEPCLKKEFKNKTRDGDEYKVGEPSFLRVLSWYTDHASLSMATDPEVYGQAHRNC